MLHPIVLGSNGETPSQTSNQQDGPLVSWKGSLIVEDVFDCDPEDLS